MSGFAEQKYSVKIRMLQQLLGTVPTQSSIWAEHISTKQAKGLKREGLSQEEIDAKLAETVAGVQDLDENKSGLTSFLKDQHGYYIEAYMVKAFFKNAAKNLKQWGALKQLQSKISNYLFVRPAKIYLAESTDKLLLIERPLRAETPQGPRTAIARSEAVAAGTELSFDVVTLAEVLPEALVKELLSYGQYQGLGQWRQGPCGTFELLNFVEV